MLAGVAAALLVIGAGSAPETISHSALADPGVTTFNQQEILDQRQCFDGQADVEGQNLGAGSPALPIASAGFIEGTHYVVSRHLTPGVVVGYDTEASELNAFSEMSFDSGTGLGAWGSTESGGDLYTAMRFDDEPAQLVRVDHETGEAEISASLAPVKFVWDMDTAPDGTIYIATSRQNSAGLWEFDPETQEAGLLTQLEDEPRQDARSVTATEDTVYVGLGNSEADLVAYDRETGDEQRILPESLSEEEWVFSLAATDDLVAVGTSSPGSIALFEPGSPEDYSSARMPTGTVQAIEIVDGTAYFASGRYLWSYQLGAEEPERLMEIDRPGGQTRSIIHHDGRLHGAGSLGYVWEYDLDKEELATTDLTDTDLSATLEDQEVLRGERAQSLAATPETVYTGGHFTLGARDQDSGALDSVPVSGEPKGLVLIEDQVFMATYSGGKLLHYNPRTEEIAALTEAPEGHNRPRDLDYHPAASSLLMTVQSDGGGGGSVVQYHLDSGETSVHEPFEDQAPSAIETAGDTVYIAGSSGMQDEGKDSVILATDLQTGEEDWSVDLTGDNSRVTSLLHHEGMLLGVTTAGTYFSIDTQTQELNLTESDDGAGDLIVHRGEVYGVTDETLFRLEPESLDREPIREDLDSHWFGWPALDSDGCSLYILEGADVIRLGN